MAEASLDGLYRASRASGAGKEPVKNLGVCVLPTYHP